MLQKAAEPMGHRRGLRSTEGGGFILLTRSRRHDRRELRISREVTANSDNIAEGKLVYLRGGSEDGKRPDRKWD